MGGDVYKEFWCGNLMERGVEEKIKLNECLGSGMWCNDLNEVVHDRDK
jgi:hypothetical protein